MIDCFFFVYIMSPLKKVSGIQECNIINTCNVNVFFWTSVAHWVCKTLDLCRLTSLCFSNWQINGEVKLGNPLVNGVSSWLFKAWRGGMNVCPVLLSIFHSACELAFSEFHRFPFEELASLCYCSCIHCELSSLKSNDWKVGNCLQTPSSSQ